MTTTRKESPYNEPAATPQEEQDRERALGKSPAPPQPHETVIGQPGPKATRVDGKEEVVETETGTLRPRDDTPFFMEKKKGPRV